jgi:4-amino-4-deoxy-L-arabinose transferase-like glycosyltransferase
MPPVKASSALPHLGLLLAVSYLLFFHHLGTRDLWSSHEGRAAQDAQSVLADGQGLVPRLLDGRPELQKPPLYYWLAAGFSWATGEVSALTARLPAAVAAALAVLTVYWALAYLGRAQLGLLAALVLATLVRFSWLGRVGRIDMPLAAVVTVGACAFYLSQQAQTTGQGRRRNLFALVGYLAIAAGILLKGPLALLLVASIGVGNLAALVARRTARPATAALAKTLLWGLPLVAALVVPWFVAADRVTDGEFTREFLWRHNLQRGLGGDDQLDGHVHPFWFYARQVWVDALPWSIAALPAVIWAARRRELWRDSACRFGLIWFISIFAFLSMMKYKRPDYLLPAYGGLALFLAGALNAWFRTLNAVAQRRCRLALAVGLGIWLAGWTAYVDLYLPAQEPVRSLVSFATEVRRQAGRAPVILFRVDSHQLAWRLGTPVTRVWEWENLDIWAAASQPRYIIMPPQWAAVWEQHLEAGRLERVLSTDETTDGRPHETPLVLFVSIPMPESASVR